MYEPESTKQRCLNPNNTEYPRYGAAGVKVAERWLGPSGYVNFLDDMGERPEGTSIDRLNSSGDYTPENCRWATPREQAMNRRNGRGRLHHINRHGKKCRVAIYLDGATKLWSFEDEEAAISFRDDMLSKIGANQ